ncbi:MAG: hypothetical protein AB7E48_06700 [Deferribacterales bacterium]
MEKQNITVSHDEKFDIGTEEPVPFKLGDWYWLPTEGNAKELSKYNAHVTKVIDGKIYSLFTVTNINSNAVDFEAPRTTSERETWRLMTAEVDMRCFIEPESAKIIQQFVGRKQEMIQTALGKLQLKSAGLGLMKLDSQQEQSDSPSTELVIHSTDTVLKEYKEGLLEFRDKTYPATKELIHKEISILSAWMSANMIGLKASLEPVGESIKKIQGKLETISLYTGLTEELLHVRKGKPAGIDEKINIFQQLLYMDEESLLSYSDGGMEFKDIHAFNKWLCKPENFERILPFSKTIVAFQVRRKTKERKYELDPWVRIELEKQDKLTFLYVRNGENLWLLSTDFEFGEFLYEKRTIPWDANSQLFVKAELWGRSVKKAEFKDETTLRNLWETWEGKKTVYRQKELFGSYEPEGPAVKRRRNDSEAVIELSYDYKENLRTVSIYEEGHYTPGAYERFDADYLYFDEVSDYVFNELSKENTFFVILQGLLDRSAVLQPIPRISLKRLKAFEHINLITSHGAIYEGAEPPSIEDYLTGLNSTVKTGDVFYGQYKMWVEKEYEKYLNRTGSAWNFSDRKTDRWVASMLKNRGNPGPSVLSACEKVRNGKHGRTIVFSWLRKLNCRGWWDTSDPDKRATIEIPFNESEPHRIYNLSNYKKGDFLKFFRDPRTRKEYLEWAPVLLSGEDLVSGRSEYWCPETNSFRTLDCRVKA